jgi:hypothetical protein
MVSRPAFPKEKTNYGCCVGKDENMTGSGTGGWGLGIGG